MSRAANGVQRTSHRGSLGPLVIGILATFVAVAGLVADPQPAQASSQKIVIVVGATGSTTSSYRSIGRSLARQARSYGARVIEVFSPHATWAHVRSAARGANLLVYLGHGNGWPSRFAPFQTRTKDGMGLNASASGSDFNTKYFGERFLDANLHLARNSVVLLLHLCYASGNPEWGGPIPSLSTAKARVDNYGAGFLRTGAKAVIAEGLGNANYVLHGLFKTNWTMKRIFWSAKSATGKFAIHFAARRSPRWAHAVMDPAKPGRYYRSIIGNLGMRASAWR
jgi:hypothetical protein